jgi:hypothetical protein
MTINKLEEILLKVYDKSTVHRKYKSGWKKENPAYGQCVPTALLVQYYFGGDIHKYKDHYFNVINGEVIDLSKSQLTEPFDYSQGKKKQPILSQSQTQERFDILRKKVENYNKR